MSFSKEISSELSEYDKILNAVVLPDSSVLFSEPFLCDGSRLGLEIVGKMDAGVTVPKEKTLIVELQDSDVKGGPYAVAAVLASKSNEAVSEGELFRFAPVSAMKTWKRIRVAGDADLSEGKLSVRIIRVVG